MYLYIIGTVRVPQNIELNRPDCLLGCRELLGGAWWSLVEPLTGAELDTQLQSILLHCRLPFRNASVQIVQKYAPIS